MREVSLRRASRARSMASGMVWANFVHRNGLAACVLWEAMKHRMVSRRSLTLVKTPRCRARRSGWPNHVSTGISRTRVDVISLRSVMVPRKGTSIARVPSQTEPLPTASADSRYTPCAHWLRNVSSLRIWSSVA